MTSPEIRILMIGQVPPPYHGQAVMIQSLFDGLYKSDSINVDLLAMNFSKTISTVGKLQWKKIVRLLLFIPRLMIGLCKKYDYVYFPPSGDNSFAFIRDLLVLFIIRKLFRKKVIFHFHAMGMWSLYTSLNAFGKLLFRFVYYKPYIAVFISQYSAQNLSFLRSLNSFIVPNGISDMLDKSYSLSKPKMSHTTTILFCGSLMENKGVYILLDTCYKLYQQNFSFKLKYIGDWTSNAFKSKVQNHPFFYHPSVSFVGTKYGIEKNKLFYEADIFCFPTKYENENFPVVLLEAMSCALPIISTKWSSIPEMITHEKSGFLIDVDDEESLMNKLSGLMRDESIRKKVGETARKEYLNNYTERRYVDNFIKNLEIIHLKQRRGING